MDALERLVLAVFGGQRLGLLGGFLQEGGRCPRCLWRRPGRQAQRWAPAEWCAGLFRCLEEARLVSQPATIGTTVGEAPQHAGQGPAVVGSVSACVPQNQQRVPWQKVVEVTGRSLEHLVTAVAKQGELRRGGGRIAGHKR
ncbi:hypothetical protein GCM10020000_83550 [Streptomyces olivoverticillatus]